MLFFLDQAKAVRLVNVPGGVENAVRPERELLVFPLSGKSDAFVDETLSDSLSARGRCHEQQPELRDGGSVLDQEDRPHALITQLGDPATLALRVEGSDEVHDDPSD